MKSDYYPDILKIAKIIHLHKGGSKANLNTYRPITILSSINKVFETIWRRCLIKYWEKITFFIIANLVFESNTQQDMQLLICMN